MKYHAKIATSIVHWVLLCVIAISAYSVWQLEQRLSLQYRQIQQQQYYEQQLIQQQQAIVQLAKDYPIELLLKDGQPMGLSIEQSLSLSEWQQLLATLQQTLWISPQAVSWSRTGERWSGNMMWRLHRPTTLNPEFNVLPISLTEKNNPPMGQLVSIVKDKHTAALLQIGREQIWLREGSWHPHLQATLAKVEQNAVWLQGRVGEPYKMVLGTGQGTSTSMGGDE